MKTIKSLLMVMCCLALTFSGGALIGAVVSYPITGGIITAIGSLLPGAPAGSLMVGSGSILEEYWTGELIKKLRADTSWMSTIGARNELVNNNAIHMVDVGVDPEVLINNTTYPIPTFGRTDEDISISLDKFDTTNTKVSKDELYALSYDKNGSVIEQHGLALIDKEAKKSAHSLAPDHATDETPILLTTGDNNGRPQARKRLTLNDIIDAKERLDELLIPGDDGQRILVLCAQHYNDLLRKDEMFLKQFRDTATGKVLPLMGFSLYQYNLTPNYKIVTGALKKKAWGAAAEPDVDQNASFFFYAPRAFQATGTLDMFYRIASLDPENRQNTVGFQQYHICLPKQLTGFGALVSDFVPQT